MTPESAPDLLSLLEQSRDALIAAVDGLAEADAIRTPEAGKWSALGCVEHVTTTEERFLSRLEASAVGETPGEGRVERFAALTANRVRRVEAPERARPTGRFESLAEALAAFRATRGRSIQMVRERALDLPVLRAEHAFLGTVDGRELMAIVAGHASRHAAQIRELRAALRV